MAAAAQAQFEAYLTSIAFTDVQSESLINQGITSFNSLKGMSEKDIHEMCVYIRRLPRVDPQTNQLVAPTAIPISHERNLKLTAYYIRHLDRTQRTFVANLATLERLEDMQTLMEEEREAKEKKITPLTKLESVAKIRVAIENINDHLFKLRGSSGVPLSYIIREDIIPLAAAHYPDDISEMIGRAPHVGRFYRSDNEEVWNVIRTVLYDSDGWSWVTAFEATKDGRGAYFALKRHYLGTSHQSLIKSTADANVDNTYYDGDKRGFTFEKYCQIHKQAHKDLADFDEVMTEDRKVRKFLQGIRAQNLAPAKSTVIATDTLNMNFDATVNFMTTFAAQTGLLTNTRRNISSVGQQKGRGEQGGRAGRGGRGRGRGDGRGGRGGSGRGGRGGRGRGRGGDGNVTDRYYSYDEWSKLTADQQQKIRDLRNERDRARGVAAIQTGTSTTNDQQEAAGTGVGTAMSQRNHRNS